MTTEDILNLRDLGEVSTVQFKERLMNNYDIGCELIALSNIHGDILIVGINDVHPSISRKDNMFVFNTIKDYCLKLNRLPYKIVRLL